MKLESHPPQELTQVPFSKTECGVDFNINTDTHECLRGVLMEYPSFKTNFFELFFFRKASIFRMLELFSEKEIVHVIEDGCRSFKYELCYNKTHHTISDQHVHFYCERCKETYCFESDRIPQVNIPEGFYPHAINYMIKGICPKCSK